MTDDFSDWSNSDWYTWLHSYSTVVLPRRFRTFFIPVCFRWDM